MGDAFLCDRCDGYESGKPVAGVTIRTPKVENPDLKATREYEFCSRCLASLQDWIEYRRRDPKAGFGRETAGGAS